MTDPERYLDASGSDLRGRLLRSAAGDGPSERSWQRALTAVGAATAVTAATGSGAASLATGTVSVWLKWLGIGVLAGGLTAFGADRLLRDEARPASVAAPVEARVETPALPKLEPKAPPPSEPAQVVVPPPERVKTGALSSAPIAPGDSLARELAMVDAARARLRAGDASGTQAKLDEYQKEFPRGRFAEEAGLLRAEASILRGDCKTVRTLRNVFDGDSGKSVLSRRWKALADRCP